MAKVSLSKITPIKKMDIVTVEIGDQVVEVEQYLPIQDKADLVETVLNSTVDDTGFFNPLKMEVYFLLNLIKYYTNISLTEKMMEDAQKTYDLLELNGIFDKVIAAMPDDEYQTVFDACEEASQHVVEYLNSFVGMLRTVSADYSASQINVDKIMSTLNSPEEIGFLKEVLEKIG